MNYGETIVAWKGVLSPLLWNLVNHVIVYHPDQNGHKIVGYTDYDLLSVYQGKYNKRKR